MVIDLDTIWRLQDVSLELSSGLNVAAAEAQEVITNPPQGFRNFGEWAKKQACWKWMEERKLNHSEDFDKVLISFDLANESIREARSDKAVETSVEAELEVHQLGASFGLRHAIGREKMVFFLQLRTVF